MLRLHPARAAPATAEETEAAIREALWIDLHTPTAAEIRATERASGIRLPGWEAISEIEPSSRVYALDGAVVMNLQLISGAETATPEVAHASLILTDRQLITIRRKDSRAFDALDASFAGHDNAADLLVRLLGLIVDRYADLLENAGERLDRLSAAIFRFGDRENLRLSTAEMRSILQGVGRVQYLLNKIYESLATQLRVAGFLAADAQLATIARPFHLEHKTAAALQPLSHDIKGLSGHSSYLIETANFLLDAIVGRLSIEQNAVMTAFSVIAVIFLPPTLIAGIYGMNFRDMPELALPYAYPLALAVMLLSAILPYLWFKKKGWL